jgi:hypothetical protein
VHQQLWGYKVEEKLYVGVREQKRLNTNDLEVTSLSPGQEIARFLWNPKVHYRVKMSPALGRMLSKMNPIHHLIPVTLRPILILFPHIHMVCMWLLNSSQFQELKFCTHFSSLSMLHAMPISTSLI